MYFKILLVFAVLAVRNSICDERKAVHFVPAAAPNIIKTAEQCLVEYNIDPKVLYLVRDGSYATDDAFQKFVYCTFYKAGYANKDGTVLVDNVIKAFPADANIGPVTKKCSTIEGKDAVDTTYEFFKCFEINSPVRIAIH